MPPGPGSEGIVLADCCALPCTTYVERIETCAPTRGFDVTLVDAGYPNGVDRAMLVP
jgi:hypothetical protein